MRYDAIRNDLETSILGTIIYEDRVNEIQHILSWKNFSKKDFHIIYNEILLLNRQYESYDLLSLRFALIKRTGIDYKHLLLDLISKSGTAESLQYYSLCLLEIDIIEKFVKRLEDYERELLNKNDLKNASLIKKIANEINAASDPIDQILGVPNLLEQKKLYEISEGFYNLLDQFHSRTEKIRLSDLPFHRSIDRAQIYLNELQVNSSVKNQISFLLDQVTLLARQK